MGPGPVEVAAGGHAGLSRAEGVVLSFISQEQNGLHRAVEGHVLPARGGTWGHSPGHECGVAAAWQGWRGGHLRVAVSCVLGTPSAAGGPCTRSLPKDSRAGEPGPRRLPLLV